MERSLKAIFVYCPCLLPYKKDIKDEPIKVLRVNVW